MIRFSLSCAKGHAFDAWFATGAAFDAQREAGLLACPVCGETKVDKAPMAPAVTSPKKRKGRGGPPAPAEAAGGAVFRPDPGAEEIRAALRALREHVTAHADYVGDRFAEEARKIHYEEADKRGIYGEATGEQARELAEEGIEFHSLPVLPEERN